MLPRASRENKTLKKELGARKTAVYTRNDLGLSPCLAARRLPKIPGTNRRIGDYDY